MVEDNMSEQSCDYVRLANETFAADLYATKLTKCEVVEARPGYSVCEIKLGPEHKNAMGNVMGGATFTLADFSTAVAGNLDRREVSSTASVQYLGRCKGDKLIATAVATKRGRSLSYYTSTINDEFGNPVAVATFTAAVV